MQLQSVLIHAAAIRFTPAWPAPLLR